MANRGDPRLKRAYRDGFRTKILQRDGYVCFYCGQDADQVDHVIPISKAPELVVSPDNAVACCKRCNTRKGNRSQGVFLATSATPPVFSSFLSPMQSKVHQDSPFTARPNPDQA
jgi:5-methylcytosine-specific restriction endonuclease McrA